MLPASPAATTSFAVPGTAAVSYANSMVPMTVVIGYVNYAIVAVAGGMLCIKGLADVGALASYLVFVRQAAMPINQLRSWQLFAQRAGRCRAPVCRHGP